MSLVSEASVLSAAESARSYYQPGLHRHQSGRGVQATRPRPPTSSGVASTSPISQDHGLGLKCLALPTVLDDFSRFIVAWKLLCDP